MTSLGSWWFTQSHSRIQEARDLASTDRTEDTQMGGWQGRVFGCVIDVEVEIKKAGGNKERNVEGPC